MAVVTGSVIANTLKCFLETVGEVVVVGVGVGDLINNRMTRCMCALSYLVIEFYYMPCKPHLNNILSLSSLYSHI